MAVCVEAVSVPSGSVEVFEPVEVVVPAVDPASEPVCDEPEAPVVVEAVPVDDGVAVEPAGLSEPELLSPLPDDELPAVDVPSAVVEVSVPEPCAVVELVLDGVVEVLEPVCVPA